MPAQHIALARLVDEAIRVGGWGPTLELSSVARLGPEHRRWLASMCMLGALSSPDVDARLNHVLEAFEPGRRLAGWLPSGMRETERTRLLSAITGRGSYLYDLHGNADAGPNPALLHEIALVADDMDAAGRGVIWPGAIPLRSDDRTRVGRLIAGLIELLYSLTGACVEHGPGTAMTRCGVLRDRSWLDTVRVVDGTDIPDGDFAILEAEPSWRKTAEALAHGVRLCRSGRSEGITWLLPTREAARHVWLQLCQLAPDAIIVLGLWQDHLAAPNGDVHGPGNWFLEQRHHNFAAPICVATMEHGYKALRETVPHSFAYSTSIARNLLILDGITPADTWNLSHASAFVHNQLQVGGSALVVTSGLDQTSRQVLDAFARPIVGDNPPYPNQPAAPYGAVWTRSAPDEPLRSVALPIHNTQRIRVELRAPEEEEGHYDYSATLREAFARARAGARVAIIRTTNREVYDTAQYGLNNLQGADVMLHAAAPGCAPLPVTFRSRYFAPERHCIDTAMRAEFDISRRRNGRLVVASGLIDHSLDTSFDLVVTDLPPFDLLVRRMALLSRGAAGCWRPEPEIWVLFPHEGTTPQAARITRHSHAVEATGDRLAELGDHHFSFDCTRERLEAVYRTSYMGAPNSDLQGLLGDVYRARRLSLPTPFGGQPNGDTLLMRGERRQAIRFQPGTVSALGFPLDHVVFYAKQDDAYAPYEPVNPHQGVHTLDWTGNIHHVADSLGYHNPNANPDEDPNAQDYDNEEHD